jgi:hypothetical protein
MMHFDMQSATLHTNGVPRIRGRLAGQPCFDVSHSNHIRLIKPEEAALREEVTAMTRPLLGLGFS